MTETVQNVFDDLWNRYELVCNNSEFETGQGCPSGPRGLSVYDMTIRERFLKAFKAESEEQQKCPYCHEYEEAYSSIKRVPDWAGKVGKPIGGAGFYILIGNNGNALIFNAHQDEWLGIHLAFCPMCGRRLEAKK